MDFKVLEHASESVQDRLRADETNPDLYDQFTFRPDILGSQRYYTEPYHGQWGSMVEYGDFIPLPRKILEQCGRMECASFMGVLPEINRVWITVDNKLYLWNYMQPGEYELYDGMSEVIVSVGLTAPKSGVFVDSIKYMLVLANPLEVTLLAISCDPECANLKIHPTAYTLPSDNVAMIRVAGTQNGRIFMAGSDGNVHELDYSNVDNSWASFVGLKSKNMHKCRKINHCAWNWRLVHALPPFFRAMVVEDDSLVDLVVDDVRHVCYSISARGILSAFYLGASSEETHSFLPTMNVLDAAKQHLSRNRNLSESSPKPESFTSAPAAGFTVSSLHVVSLLESKKVHAVVVLHNGIRIYLSLLTGMGGIYSHIPKPPATAQRNAGWAGSSPVDTFFFSDVSLDAPGGMQVSYIRSPPPPAAIRASHRAGAAVQLLQQDEASSSESINGFVPTFLPSQALRVGTAVATQGITLLALDRQQHPDEVVGMFEDIIGRSHISMGLAPAFQPPSMREGISVVLDETVGSAADSGGKVYDIRESCSQIRYQDTAALCSLFAHSNTPTNSMIKEKSHHVESSHLSSKTSSRQDSFGWVTAGASSSNVSTITAPTRVGTQVPVWPGTVPLGMASGVVRGYEPHNLEHITQLGEMSWQHVPSSSVSLRRQFLVLTNQGLHILQKLRPADILYRILSQINVNSEDLCRRFFTSYGPLQASTMCIGLACGLPCDAGADFTHAALNPLRSAGSSIPLDTMQLRAMSTMLSLTQGPSFKGHSQSPAAAGTAGSASSTALQDSRLVLSGSAHEFMHSAAHDGLHIVCSRILRPMWLRAVLDASGTKVNNCWTPALIAEVRAPLFQLQRVTRGFFAAAVVTDPNQLNFMATLNDNMVDDLLTKQLMQQAQNQQLNTERILRQHARQLEDTSINALYRLVARALHAMSLLEVLLSVQSDHKVAVSWSQLESISFRTLVVSQRAHEAVKKVVFGALNQLRRANKTHAVDQVVHWLSTECFHYFSFGDRSAFEASQILESIKETLKAAATPAEELDDGQKNRIQSLTNQAIQLLLSASEYWLCAEYVVGDTSPLFSESAKLLQLGRSGRLGVVDLCLAAAANFSDDEAVNQHSAAAAHVRKRISSLQSASLPAQTDTAASQSWEERLYHGGAKAVNTQERRECLQACYSCLVQSIMVVGSAPEYNKLGSGAVVTEVSAGGRPNVTRSSQQEQAAQEMIEMITRALQTCADPDFHQLLGERMLKDHPQLLLQVTAPFPFVETFLRSSDADLLFSYYELHGSYGKAAAWMGGLARTTEDLDIAVRISYLKRAVTSAERAAGSIASPAVMPSVLLESGNNEHITHENLLDLKDTLQIAEHQRMACSKLAADVDSYRGQYTALSDSQRRQVDQMQHVERRCRLQLLGIAELFHDVCMPYKLWEVCLLLLHVSKHDDLDLVCRLWKSVIYRVVPAEGIHEEAQMFLRMRRDPSRIEIDKRHQRQDVMFEDADQWLAALELQVIEIGQKLDGAQGSVALPFSILLEELEELVATLAITRQNVMRQHLLTDQQPLRVAPGRDWAVRCLREIGFSYAALLEAYMEVFDRWAGKSPEKLLQILSSSALVLLQWTKSAVQHTSMAVAETRQLVQAVRHGRMRHWLEKLRRHLSTLSSRKLSSVDGNDLLKMIGEEITEVNRRVAELTYA